MISDWYNQCNSYFSTQFYRKRDGGGVELLSFLKRQRNLSRFLKGTINAKFKVKKRKRKSTKGAAKKSGGQLKLVKS